MSLPLSTIVTGIVNAYSAVKALEPPARSALSILGTLVSSAESAFQSGAGVSKKAAVLGAASAFATSLGANWSALEADVGAIVDAAVAAHKAVTPAPAVAGPAS